MKAMISIGSLFFLSKLRKKPLETDDELCQDEQLLCKFVFDGSGKKIGESIAIEEDVLIIKRGDVYLGVPLKHIEDEEKSLLVRGLIDDDKALELGKKWCEKVSIIPDKFEGRSNGHRI